MPNPMKGEFDLVLGKEVYKCRLNIDALIKVETELGKGIIQLATEISQAKITLFEITTVLYYAVRGGGKDVTKKDINNIVATHGIITVCTEVAKLLVATLSDAEADSEGKQQAEA